MVYIYALIDPRNNECRYIGKTANTSKRFSAHIRASLVERTHKAAWVKSLLAISAAPTMEIIDIALPDCADECEREWIAYFKFLGADLCNHTQGGDGGAGPRSAETRAKISKALEGHAVSKETKSKIGIKNTGNKHSLGHVHTEDSRSRMSKGMQSAWGTRKEKRLCSSWNKGCTKFSKATKESAVAAYVDGVKVQDILEKYCVGTSVFYGWIKNNNSLRRR